MAKKEEKKVADDFADLQDFINKAAKENEAADVKSAQAIANALLDEQQRRDQEFTNNNLGSMSQTEFRRWVRVNWGYDPA